LLKVRFLNEAMRYAILIVAEHFHKKYGYGARALVEAQISRIKRCIGYTLRTQKIESQQREGIIIGNLINKWNSFGKCVSVKVG